MRISQHDAMAHFSLMHSRAGPAARERIILTENIRLAVQSTQKPEEIIGAKEQYDGMPRQNRPHRPGIPDCGSGRYNMHGPHCMHPVQVQRGLKLAFSHQCVTHPARLLDRFSIGSEWLR